MNKGFSEWPLAATEMNSFLSSVFVKKSFISKANFFQEK